MGRTATAMAIVVALGLATTSVVAWADKPWERGVSETDKTAARTLTSEGVKAAGESRWPEAADKFRLALKRWDHPRIHYNLIEPLVMLDKPLEADRHLAKALAHGREGLGADKYRDALLQQKQLAGRIATLTLECTQPGAQVSLDGKALFTAPGKHTQKLAPGTHVVVTTRKGHFPSTRSLVLIGGKQTVETLTLVKLSAGKTIYKRRFRSWLPWAAVGSSALVGIVGLGLRTLAKSSFDQYDTFINSNCDPSCAVDEVAAQQHVKDRGGLYNGAAIGSFVVAGGLLLSGLTIAILNSPRAVGVERPTPLSGPRIVPSASRSGARVHVAWAF